MKLKHLTISITAATCLLAIVAASASATPALVNVRVEGATRTIFEGPVLVQGRTVTTENGGMHECNGTNNKAYPSSVPVPTAALADAAYLGQYYPSGAFTFNAGWDSEYEDFFITRIAETTQTSSEFWAIAVDDQLIPVGGCQFQLHNFDEVLFTLYGFDEEPLLKLTGPSIAIGGRPITVKVTNGSNGEPIAGAVVAPAGSTSGAETNSNGEATVTFNHPGLTRLKASKPGSVRSNGLIVADL